MKLNKKLTIISHTTALKKTTSKKTKIWFIIKLIQFKVLFNKAKHISTKRL